MLDWLPLLLPVGLPSLYTLWVVWRQTMSKSKLVAFRLTPAEMAVLESRAAQAELSISAYLRSVVVSGRENQVKIVSCPPNAHVTY